MGWAIAGGVLGLVIMVLAWYWLRSWATAHAGGNVDARIGTRPRRLAGVPEEVNPQVKAAPAMEIMAISDLRRTAASAPDGKSASVTTAKPAE